MPDLDLQEMRIADGRCPFCGSAWHRQSQFWGPGPDCNVNPDRMACALPGCPGTVATTQAVGCDGCGRIFCAQHEVVFDHGCPLETRYR